MAADAGQRLHFFSAPARPARLHSAFGMHSVPCSGAVGRACFRAIQRLSSLCAAQGQTVDRRSSPGFYEIAGGGKGSHRKFSHARYPGAVTLSGGAGDDAKHYQEKQVRRAIERVKQ